VVKVRQLEQAHALLLAELREGDGGAGAEHDAASTSTSLDVATVLKVARAIAVEIELDDLLRKLVQLALENAGAERGLFLQERNGTLLIEAEATATDGTVRVRQGTPWTEVDSIAHSVVRYVSRTGQDVVLGNAAADQRFGSDEYISRVGPKSVLCVRVGHQERGSGCSTWRTT